MITNRLLCKAYTNNILQDAKIVHNIERLCRIYTFVRVARRIARRMASVPITYSPRHSLHYSPRHLWRSHSKQFFKHESKETSGNLRYAYEHGNVRTHVKLIIHTETEAYECSCKWRGEARARICKCGITCTQKI